MHIQDIHIACRMMFQVAFALLVTTAVYSYDDYIAINYQRLQRMKDRSTIHNQFQFINFNYVSPPSTEENTIDDESNSILKSVSTKTNQHKKRQIISFEERDRLFLFYPNTLDFGSQLIGNVKVRYVTIKNLVSDRNITITSIETDSKNIQVEWNNHVVKKFRESEVIVISVYYIPTNTNQIFERIFIEIEDGIISYLVTGTGLQPNEKEETTSTKQIPKSIISFCSKMEESDMDEYESIVTPRTKIDHFENYTHIYLQLSITYEMVNKSINDLEKLLNRDLINSDQSKYESIINTLTGLVNQTENVEDIHQRNRLKSFLSQEDDSKEYYKRFSRYFLQSEFNQTVSGKHNNYVIYPLKVTTSPKTRNLRNLLENRLFVQCSNFRVRVDQHYRRNRWRNSGTTLMLQWNIGRSRLDVKTIFRANNEPILSFKSVSKKNCPILSNDLTISSDNLFYIFTNFDSKQISSTTTTTRTTETTMRTIGEECETDSHQYFQQNFQQFITSNNFVNGWLLNISIEHRPIIDHINDPISQLLEESPQIFIWEQMNHLPFTNLLSESNRQKCPDGLVTSCWLMQLRRLLTIDEKSKEHELFILAKRVENKYILEKTFHFNLTLPSILLVEMDESHNQITNQFSFNIHNSTLLRLDDFFYDENELDEFLLIDDLMVKVKEYLLSFMKQHQNNLLNENTFQKFHHDIIQMISDYFRSINDSSMNINKYFEPYHQLQVKLMRTNSNYSYPFLYLPNFQSTNHLNDESILTNFFYELIAKSWTVLSENETLSLLLRKETPYFRIQLNFIKHFFEEFFNRLPHPLINLTNDVIDQLMKDEEITNENLPKIVIDGMEFFEGLLLPTHPLTPHNYSTIKLEIEETLSVFDLIGKWMKSIQSSVYSEKRICLTQSKESKYFLRIPLNIKWNHLLHHSSNSFKFSMNLFSGFLTMNSPQYQWKDGKLDLGFIDRKHHINHFSLDNKRVLQFRNDNPLPITIDSISLFDNSSMTINEIVVYSGDCQSSNNDDCRQEFLLNDIISLLLEPCDEIEFHFILSRFYCRKQIDNEFLFETNFESIRFPLTWSTNRPLLHLRSDVMREYIGELSRILTIDIDHQQLTNIPITLGVSVLQEEQCSQIGSNPLQRFCPICNETNIEKQSLLKVYEVKSYTKTNRLMDWTFTSFVNQAKLYQDNLHKRILNCEEKGRSSGDCNNKYRSKQFILIETMNKRFLINSNYIHSLSLDRTPLNEPLIKYENIFLNNFFSNNHFPIGSFSFSHNDNNKINKTIENFEYISINSSSTMSLMERNLKDLDDLFQAHRSYERENRCNCSRDHCDLVNGIEPDGHFEIVTNLGSYFYGICFRSEWPEISFEKKTNLKERKGTSPQFRIKKLKFDTIHVSQTSQKRIYLDNPSSHVVNVQPIFLHELSTDNKENKKLLKKLKEMFSSSLSTFNFNKSKAKAFTLAARTLKSKKNMFYSIPPTTTDNTQLNLMKNNRMNNLKMKSSFDNFELNITLNNGDKNHLRSLERRDSQKPITFSERFIDIKFNPQVRGNHSTILLIQNNLSVFDIWIIEGYGTVIVLRFGDISQNPWEIQGMSGSSLPLAEVMRTIGNFNKTVSAFIQSETNNDKDCKLLNLTKYFPLSNYGNLPLKIIKIFISRHKPTLNDLKGESCRARNVWIHNVHCPSINRPLIIGEKRQTWIHLYYQPLLTQYIIHRWLVVGVQTNTTTIFYYYVFRLNLTKNFIHKCVLQSKETTLHRREELLVMYCCMIAFTIIICLSILYGWQEYQEFYFNFNYQQNEKSMVGYLYHNIFDTAIHYFRLNNLTENMKILLKRLHKESNNTSTVTTMTNDTETKSGVPSTKSLIVEQPTNDSNDSQQIHQRTQQTKNKMRNNNFGGNRMKPHKLPHSQLRHRVVTKNSFSKTKMNNPVVLPVNTAKPYVVIPERKKEPNQNEKLIEHPKNHRKDLEINIDSNSDCSPLLKITTNRETKEKSPSESSIPSSLESKTVGKSVNKSNNSNLAYQYRKKEYVKKPLVDVSTSSSLSPSTQKRMKVKKINSNENIKQSDFNELSSTSTTDRFLMETNLLNILHREPDIETKVKSINKKPSNIPNHIITKSFTETKKQYKNYAEAIQKNLKTFDKSKTKVTEKPLLPKNEINDDIIDFQKNNDIGRIGDINGEFPLPKSNDKRKQQPSPSVKSIVKERRKRSVIKKTVNKNVHVKQHYLTEEIEKRKYYNSPISKETSTPEWFDNDTEINDDNMFDNIIENTRQLSHRRGTLTNMTDEIFQLSSDDSVDISLADNVDDVFRHNDDGMNNVDSDNSENSIDSNSSTGTQSVLLNLDSELKMMKEDMVNRLNGLDTSQKHDSVSDWVGTCLTTSSSILTSATTTNLNSFPYHQTNNISSTTIPNYFIQQSPILHNQQTTQPIATISNDFQHEQLNKVTNDKKFIMNNQISYDKQNYYEGNVNTNTRICSIAPLAAIPLNTNRLSNWSQPVNKNSLFSTFYPIPQTLHSTCPPFSNQLHPQQNHLQYSPHTRQTRGTKLSQYLNNSETNINSEKINLNDNPNFSLLNNKHTHPVRPNLIEMKKEKSNNESQRKDDDGKLRFHYDEHGTLVTSPISHQRFFLSTKKKDNVQPDVNEDTLLNLMHDNN
ncbi:hypothetical protein SNEBB_008919 [Seison nebaliae]|nr:hypothetical protein SNEBB_008919 [Seison nebaliae]